MRSESFGFVGGNVDHCCFDAVQMYQSDSYHDELARIGATDFASIDVNSRA